MRRLASVEELNSTPYRSFMAWVNAFARLHGLRVHTNWSKVWEYPWAWLHLSRLQFPGLKILDIGSEISPMPWFFASLGADVTLVESSGTYVPKWQELKDLYGFSVRWEITAGPRLPTDDETFDLVTSFSVIEHIVDKQTAVKEVVRVLKPDGVFCLTFDVCESSRGMTFPEWNGSALDLGGFERLIWSRQDLEPLTPTAQWNLEDMDSFVRWNLQSAPHHNYTVGGAVLRKRNRSPNVAIGSKRDRIRVHQLDTGLGSGNIGDDAMFIAAHAQLPSVFQLSTEAHSLERAELWPGQVRYVSVKDSTCIEQCIREAELVLLIGDTPVMDQWGLGWPLLANAEKLRLCHRLGKPVHAVGVGVDRLESSEGLRIFRECYAPISSWSVRSEQCKKALEEMGVPEEKIVVGADWSWLLRPKIDTGWAEKWLRKCGAIGGKKHIGVNLVNEIWKGEKEIKNIWASLLDRLVERHDAQIFFFCNESRAGDYFDRAAAEEVQGRMRHPSVLVTNRYYEPSQMISLLAAMHVTISARYHFTIFSILADVYPISIQRGQKMQSLNQELALPFAGDMVQVEEEVIEREIKSALMNPEAKLQPLRVSRDHLAARAANNLSLLRYSLWTMLS